MLQEYGQRSFQPERIDTGDYTSAEYDQFLKDIQLVNRFAGDNWALGKTLLRKVKRGKLREFSVLDVGAGSGELLRTCARFARRTKRMVSLCGLELNKRSAAAILDESMDYREISAIRGNALKLPFDDDSFDFVICSLFTHHFGEDEILLILAEMSRVARRKIFVIDLHRHPMASLMFRGFCAIFVKGILVKTDGALSILRGFTPVELEQIAKKARLKGAKVRRHFPFRLVLEAKCE